MLSPAAPSAPTLASVADPVRLPYAAASFAQRQQALLSARQVLAVAYPQLADAEWVAALDQVQPPLLPADGPAVLLAPEGLAALLACLATGSLTAKPVAAYPPLAPAARAKKQTYLIELSLIEQLTNATYWLRRPVTELVNEALTQSLAQYPEAQRPRPAELPRRRFRRAKPAP